MPLTFEEWQGRLQAVADGDLFAHSLRKSLKAAAIEAESAAKLNYASRGLKRRTGHLFNSIQASVREDNGDLVMVLSAGGRVGGKVVRYAAVQEYGKTIHARPGKFLRVPLAPALTGAGVDRFPGPLKQKYPGLFHVRGFGPKGGPPLYLFRSDIEDRAWYALTKKVTIRGKHFLRDAMETAAEGVPHMVIQEVHKDLTGGQ